ncbi:MAG: phage Gp37/Gp68 family protein [Erysipelotrichaceae bacterium]|nr:phage Gp37/Gp68 family protein [Erysipelotrichaceae bacterium]
MSKTKIEWTDISWNPVTGCTKVSNGCQNCYAERMANRLKSMKTDKYKNGFKVTMHPKVLNEIDKYKSNKKIFVCSMSDLFHKEVTDEFIFDIFNVMNNHPQHTFQILTKRPERVLKLNKSLNWTSNIWFGITVEDQTAVYKIDYLKNIDAKLKFLSCEPLLSSLKDIDLNDVDWVIVGGESGPKCRECKEEWVLELKDKCNKNDIPFFFKQWGGTNKKKNGSSLLGKYYKEFPKM